MIKERLGKIIERERNKAIENIFFKYTFHFY